MYAFLSENLNDADKRFHRCYTFPPSVEMGCDPRQSDAMEVSRLRLQQTFRSLVHLAVHLFVVLATWQ